jgi:hypothetical protein
MANKAFWPTFAAVQLIGASIALLSKGHPNSVSLLASLVLLLPGDLVASIFGKISPYVFYPAVFLVNGGVWFLIKKLIPDPEFSDRP